MTPRLSVVIVAHRDSPTLTRAIERLLAQTVVAELECVLVTGSRRKVERAIRTLDGHLSFQVVEVAAVESEGAAKAAGVIAGQAPLVAFMEDHSYPQAGWAEAVMRAHKEGDYAAVGPVVFNANPDTAASWGCFLVFYGAYMWARPQEEVRHLAGNQSCYRRDVLIEYGSRLSDMLEAECVLHADLLARGYRLLQEPTAKIAHLNQSRLWPTLYEFHLASRVFAAERCSGWGPLRRAVYLAGSPLLLLIRPRRVFEDARRAKLNVRVLLKAIVPLMLIVSAGTVGEMLGYSLGTGDAKIRLMKFMSKRDAAFTPRDIQAVETV